MGPTVTEHSCALLELAETLGELATWWWTVGEDHLSWSPAFAMCLGLSPTGGHLDDLLAVLVPEDRPVMTDAIERARQDRPIERLTFRTRAVDGVLRTFESLARPIRDPHSQALVALVGGIRDVTDRRRLESQVDDSASLLDLALANAAVGMWTWHPDQAHFVCDAVTASLFQVDPEAPSHPLEVWTSRVYPEDLPRALAAFEALVERGTPMVETYRACPTPGALRWFRAEGIRRVVDGRVRIFGTCQDVTAQQRQLAQLRHSAVVFDTLLEAVLITDAQHRVISLNPAFERLTGFDAAALVGQSPTALRSGRHPDAYYDSLWREVARTHRWSGQVWLRARDGTAFLVHQTISAVCDTEGQTTHYVQVLADITQLALSKQVLTEAHQRDPLTGTVNRLVLRDRLTTALDRTARTTGAVGLAVLDVDRFHRINDALGHACGDSLLQMVAARLQSRVPDGGTLARTAGDEFTILVESVANVLEFDRILRDCLADMQQPFEVCGERLHITVSAGAGVSRAGAEGDLLEAVTVALSEAKQLGTGRICYVPHAREDGRIDDLRLEQALRDALDTRRLEVWFQPQFDLSTGALLGAEALSRWQHPTAGWISPARFIPVADDAGLIPTLNAQVIDTAVGQWARWLGRGGEPGVLALNATPSELSGTLLVDRLREALARHGLPGAALEVEVTEGALAHPGRAQRVLAGLHALGLSVAIDDFGTGYSSLGRLARLPIDRLKIDRMFVRDLGIDPRAVAVVRAVLDLARGLDLSVVAEGIETQAQHETLRRLGCTVGQGFLMGRPMPAEKFEALLTMEPTPEPRPGPAFAGVRRHDDSGPRTG